jgi:hypothetical protein
MHRGYSVAISANGHALVEERPEDGPRASRGLSALCCKSALTFSNRTCKNLVTGWIGEGSRRVFQA